MRLKFTEKLADKLESIFKSKPRPKLYFWSCEINEQFMALESRMNLLDVDLNVASVSEKGDNLHIYVVGGSEHIAALNSYLIREQAIEMYDYLLVLEQSNEEETK